MKKIILLLLITGTAVIAQAQIEKDPTHWAYALKKLTGNTYEVHLRCQVDEPWHIYAQKQGKDFIGTATKISITKMPGMKSIGTPVEVGKKEVFENKEVGITNYEYKDVVDFVQKVTIAPGIKEVKGTVIYQTCTDTHCLPATSMNFTVPVTN